MFPMLPPGDVLMHPAPIFTEGCNILVRMVSLLSFGRGCHLSRMAKYYLRIFYEIHVENCENIDISIPCFVSHPSTVGFLFWFNTCNLVKLMC